MKKIKIDIDSKSYNFEHPENFNELSENQYLHVVKVFFTEKENLEKRLDDKLYLLFVMLGGFDLKKKKRKELYNIISEIVINDSDFGSKLLELQNFIYSDKTLNTWKLPAITLNKEKFTGPDDRFNSMTFGIFIAADTLVSAYFSSKKPEKLLDMLIKVLYNISDIEGLDSIIKTGVLYNYLGVRNWLTEKYTQVFTSDDTSSRTNISLGKKESGWLSVRRHIAGSILNLKQTDNLNLHEVLSSLNHEILK